MQKKTALFIDFSGNFYDRHAVYCLTAGLAQAGVETNYYSAIGFNDALSIVRRIQPTTVLYSAWSSNLKRYIEFDRFLKLRIKVISLIGGAGPTFDYKRLSGSTIDFICIGEGDTAVPEFFRNGMRPIKNIIRTGQEPADFFPLVDLDALPMPEREPVYQADSVLKDMTAKQFLSGRGCPYDCTYCYNHVFNRMFKACGRIVRKKNAAKLIEEIAMVKRNYGLTRVIFQDDTFILDKSWLMEFSHAYRKYISLPYTCNVRANLVDESTVKILKESGCAGVNWSIESGNEIMRNQVLKRRLSKDEIMHTAKILNEFKIPHRVASLVGLPGETKDQMKETLELAIAAKPYYGFANIFVPFPGLDITAYAVERGFLHPDYGQHLPKSFYRQSILNFTDQEKKYINQIVFLFPLLVRFSCFWRISWLRKIMFGIPAGVLKLVFHIIDAWSMFWLYRPGMPLSRIFSVVKRYLKNV